ncbi:MAG: hypothetical protein AMS20_00235 [Gemmatimonas sp. SG8_28]|nr:MAG: hypothetical protein AMS20_00235 [Gemmatimonas sp. SG8_28]
MTLVELPQHPKRRYPLWDIEALRKDQEHAQDKIDSFTEAIEDLQKLIAERQEQIATCEERDREIAAWERKYGNAQLRAG